MSSYLSYEIAANRYKPDRISYLLIAESPPTFKNNEAPRYFYFENYLPSKDSLFTNIMQVLYPEALADCKKGKTKIECLQRFCTDGFFLIDAVPHPINQLTKRERNLAIRESMPRLFSMLSQIIPSGEPIPIILIKSNVYSALKILLEEKRYRVVDCVLPFPNYGHQKQFRDGFRIIVSDILDTNES